MQVAKALLPFVGPLLLGFLFGLWFPHAPTVRLVAPPLVLAFIAWIVLGWLEIWSELDADRTGYVLIWFVLLAFVIALWTIGVQTARWFRRRSAA